MDGGCYGIPAAAGALIEVAPYMPDISEMSDRINEISLELEEYASDIKDILDEFEFDPRKIDEIEYRLDAIFKLKKKYGSSIAEILEYLAKAQAELSDIELSDELSEKLTAELADVKQKAITQANELSDKRACRYRLCRACKK